MELGVKEAGSLWEMGKEKVASGIPNGGNQEKKKKKKTQRCRSC